jgi:diguanylate cyclase (GGDEF)-like protein
MEEQVTWRPVQGGSSQVSSRRANTETKTGTWGIWCGVGSARFADVMSGRLRRDGVLVLLLILMAGVGVVYGADWGHVRTQVLLCWIVMTGLHVGLAVMAAQVARAAGANRAMRRVWMAMAVAGSSYAVGDIIQLILFITRPLDSEVMLGGAMQSLAVLAGTAFLVGAMLTVPAGPSSGRQRVQYWLDVSIVMAAATTFGCYSAIGGPVSPTNLLLGLLTGPGVFLVGVFAVVKLVLGENPPMALTAGLVTGAAATLEAVLQAIYPILINHGWLSWHLGLTLIANSLLTIAARTQQLRVRRRHVALKRSCTRRVSMLPYAATVSTNVFLVVILASRDLEWQVWIVISGTIISTALVIIRQLAAFADNKRLLDELHTVLCDLHETMRERDELTAQLRHKAYHDGLTGLSNRTLFTDRLRTACEGPAGACQIAVFLIDLDGFKPVNDTFGHGVGDEVLVAVAQRMRNCVGETGLVARIGGDEFGILIERSDQDIEQLAQRIVAAIARPYQLSTAVAVITASVGVALAHRRPVSAKQLLVDADAAMYETKHSGKSGYCLSLTRLI